jgi:hypothetical protein
MKKLLAVLMVLSMAAIANAALVINVNGKTGGASIDPNETATISIVATEEQSPSDLYLFVMDGSLGTVSGGSVVWPDFSSTAGEITLHQGAGDQYVNTVHQCGWLYATQTYYINLIGNTSPPLVMNGTVVNGITYHAEIAGDSTIILGNGNIVDDGQAVLMPILDTVVIHQVPEPMTIGLLGLGGLLLRPRK